ncbi:MerR family transcriptional regulator [Pseudonocardia sp. KRD-184]|uniref:MerR family transcriptional regulator n=1 Tax=Pseudonocardia oceani TaxID=2792013 RepID=A0ABS6U2F8_9PSEU|nr:MerR family transcriptional regulator [Pseudonocardia oceani]MBW0088117.1 MerR family transcriptional regulator [Pseudonocardia oceani]MBW0096291.1 MerR family transcriptional regulator [Pseudonocardia oceani]MBW0107147.1 MerR family transcriptional regulator [Pseudonocardia oceani]MBW0119757.1 MerR family transcriptional regulator [Pseudonocardia oceani]MBW0126420.1 MerR family transcriptional regulator [Pseudonocardia oceani]
MNGREYRIDELARTAGTTVRNIRAYQDRGLLPPPRRAGRVGLYDEAHLARLRLVGRLLERGYTVQNIGELIAAWEQGRDLTAVLGLEQVVTGFWSDEIPTMATPADLSPFAGPDGLDTAITRLHDIGVIERQDADRYRVPSPRLLNALRELVSSGLPVDAVLAVAEQLRSSMNGLAARFIGGLADAVLAGHEPGWIPSGSEMTQLTAAIGRARPAIGAAVDAAFGQALERHSGGAIGDYISGITPHGGNIHDVV